MKNIGTVTVSDLGSSQIIEEGLWCKLCDSKKDFHVLSNFIKMAIEEGYPFNKVSPTEQKAFLLIDSTKKIYLGFLVWKKDQIDKNYIELEGLDFDRYKHKCCGEILQLIYIIKEERRKGFASKLIRYWVDNIANQTYEMFGVEMMGGSYILNVLIKLGYIDENDPNKSRCYLLSTERKVI